MSITAGLLGEAQQQPPPFATNHREVFERPYISALRYLHAASAPEMT
jgi:hypothetical protein